MFRGLNLLNLEALKGISVNRCLEVLRLKPRSIVTLRVEKLSGKCLVEKDNDIINRNFVVLLYHGMANYEPSTTSPSVTVTTTAGSSYSGYVGSYGSAARYLRNGALFAVSQGDVGVDTCGILIGSGTTPPTRTDYNLQSKIPHGTGTGQIYYQRQTYELLNDYQFRFTREFTNAGSDLSVAEAGIVYITYHADVARYLLLVRDTFTPITVTQGNGIRVRYTFSF